MICFDTNVLVYAINDKDPNHTKAQDFFELAIQNRQQLAISSQTIPESQHVLMKYYHQTSQTAHKVVFEVLTAFQVQILYPNQDTIRIFRKLMSNEESPKRVYDLFLASTMISNDVHEFFTFNKKDFKDIEDLTLLDLY